MQTYLHGRDLIGDLDFSKEEVETVLDVAWDLKRKRALNEPHAYLRDKVLGMLFFFSSTRTRCSLKLVSHSWADMAHSLSPNPPRSHMAILRKRSARSLGDISMALPSAIVTGKLATDT